jgi:glucosyl-dolichyl phosphate glucuronosyltransferase
MMKFSIIIPTFNRGEILKKVLFSVVSLDFSPKYFEILVVDNNSTDKTKRIISECILKYPKIKIKYFFEKKQGPSFARNRGLEKAKYPYIICLDDDVIVSKELLNKYFQSFEKNPSASIIGGQNIPVCDNKTKLQKFTKILSSNSWVLSDTKDLYIKSGMVNYPDTLISANICINTNITGKISFDTHFGKRYGSLLVFGEDSELCLRLLSGNKKIYFDSSIKSRHIISEGRLSFKYILKRFFAAGIEQKLLDDKYEDTLGRLYQPSLRNLLRLFISWLMNVGQKAFLLFVKEVIFMTGYYFPLGLLKHNI